MDLNTYQKICAKTAKKFDSKDKEILTWGLGITGEAGDVASCIKKTFIHDNDQKQGIKENVGDTFWYAAMICNFFGWNMDEVLKQNVEKLRKRYPQGFTIENARRENKMIDWSEK